MYNMAIEYELLDSRTYTDYVTEFTISNIPSTRRIYILFDIYLNANGTNNNFLNLIINNDTGSNYANVIHYVHSDGHSSSLTWSTNGMVLCKTAWGKPADIVGEAIIKSAAYVWTPLLSNFTTQTSSGTGHETIASFWKSTTAISSIQFKVSNTSYGFKGTIRTYILYY